MEAALLMPAVLAVLLFIWQLAIYYHNQAAGRAICQEALYKGCNQQLLGGDGEAAAMRTLEEQSRYLRGVSDITISAKCSGASLAVSISGTMDFFPLRLLGTSQQPLEVGAEAEGVWESPAEGIRRLRLLEQYGDG